MSSSTPDHRTLIYILAAAFSIWGVIGILDFKNNTYLGYDTDGNHTVIDVEEGSPAEKAGLEVGDEIKSIDEIAITDSKSLMKRARARVGDTRTWTVERNEDTVDVPITYAVPPSKDKMLNWIGLIVGFLFILFGVLAYHRRQTQATLYFALFGLLFGFSFLDGPYFASHMVRQIIGVIALPLILFGFAFLLNLMLVHPKSRNFLSNKTKVRLLYTPAVILSLVFIFLIAFQPDSTSSLNTLMRFLIGFFIVFYFGWSLIAMVQNYTRASVEERKAEGLGIMLWGTVIALVPLLILIIVQTASPSTVVPGSDYFVILFALIPITYWMALTKGSQPAEA